MYCNYDRDYLEQSTLEWALTISLYISIPEITCEILQIRYYKSIAQQHFTFK